MKTLIATTVLFLLACPSIAGQSPEVSEFSPPAPTLKLAERSDGGPNGYRVIFKGRARLTGKLVVEFDRTPGVSEYKDTTGASFFLPDTISKTKLPAAIGSFYPSPVDSIELDQSPSKLLLVVVGKTETQRILNGDLPRYEIAAKIEIKSFSSWVECDHRSYTAEVVSASASRPQVIARAQGELIGC